MNELVSVPDDRLVDERWFWVSIGLWLPHVDPGTVSTSFIVQYTLVWLESPLGPVLRATV
jgi:hypothetical protein